MKRMVCGLLAVMLSVSSVAGESGRQPASEKALMVYMSVPMGPSARGKQEALSFGLRLQQSTPMNWQRPVPLMDFRLRLDGRKTLQGVGVMMLDSFDSGGGSFSGRPWLLALTAAGAGAALACLLSVGICDGGDDEYEYTPGGG
jgi:hypothetical protein